MAVALLALGLASCASNGDHFSFRDDQGFRTDVFEARSGDTVAIMAFANTETFRGDDVPLPIRTARRAERLARVSQQRADVLCGGPATLLRQNGQDARLSALPLHSLPMGRYDATFQCGAAQPGPPPAAQIQR